MKISNNRRVWMGAMLAGAVLGAGCVTINIYFPAAAAEKAADRIIDEVWQLKNAVPGTAAPATAPATATKPPAK